VSRRGWPVTLAALVFLATGCGAEDPTREAAREETQRRQETLPQELTGAETTVGELTIGEVDDAEDGRLLIQSGQSVVNDSYVSPLAEIYGDVEIGAESFVAENTVLRAAPEQRLELGGQTNLQDNVVARALDDDSTIGDRTSVSHHALVRDAEIGDFAFVGFNAEVVDATVGDGALISAGALVEGVEVPDDALVGPGEEITTQEQADALPTTTATEEDFKEALLAVNAEFAENYMRLYEDEGYDAVIGVGPNPTTEFNPERVEPQIGTDSEIGEFARVVGDVRLGPGSEVGDRASIRADEGSPIIVGRNANIEERVTFHALVGTGITIGDNLDAGDAAVLHGPLEAGDDLKVGDDSVVFRVRVGDNVTIGEDVVIQGPPNEDDPEEPTLVIPEGIEVPDGSVITSQEDLEVLPETTGPL
jgi:carbon dioxide concentrating mechanism protein CcmM